MSKPKPVTVTDESTMTTDDFSTGDQERIKLLTSEVDTLSMEFRIAQLKMEAAQSQLELHQAKLELINKVKVPELINGLRDRYNMPTNEWVFNLKTFTFTKLEGVV